MGDGGFLVACSVDRVRDGVGARLEFQTGSDWLLACAFAKPRVIRSIEVFAESEVVVPDGPFVGQRYSCDRQPYSRLWFRAIDASEGRGESGRSGQGGRSGRREEPPLPPRKRGGRKNTAGTVAAPQAVEPHSLDVEDLGDARVVWRNFIAVGPTQSGKTLTCLIIPVMYHLFEVGETVICVVPDLNMVNDKWTKDFLPAIQASRYRTLLPTRGEGSRGGAVSNSVTFGNGVTLKFMTAGGGDTNRAAFTSRVVAITELNKFGKRKESSSEADMFRQVRGRMRAYGDRARLYGECTVTTEHGLVWTEYSNGTHSRIASPCPHCEEYVSPGRENLIGWDEASTAVEAERLAQWCCPKCGTILSERDRRKMARRAVLLHKGQEVQLTMDNGQLTTKRKRGGSVRPGGSATRGKRKQGAKSPLSIVGDPPETYTLGFRWSAFDNLFLSTGYLGSGEWTARNLAENAENAELEQLQFVWAMPVPDSSERSVALKSDELCHRQGRFARGVIPPGAGLVAFLDLGKYRCHWVVLAGARTPGASMRYWLVDCGVIRTDVGPLSERDGLLVAMREFHDICEAGFISAADAAESQTGMSAPLERWSPALRFVDSGAWSTVVYEFMVSMAREGHDGYFPSKGHGASQDQGRVYREQKTINDRVLVIGDRYHVARQELTEASGAELEVALVHVDVDAWKTRVHGALRVEPGAPGSLMLWKGDWKEHMSIARSLLSEVMVENFEPDKGMVITWEKKHRDNHFFDGFVGCLAALDYLGYLEEEEGQLTVDSGQLTVGDGLRPGEGEVPEGRLLGEVNFGGALKRG